MEAEVGRNMEAANYKGERERTTFRLPKWLHKEIKKEAVDLECDMTDIIVEQLAKRYKDGDPLFFSTSPEAQLHENTESIAR
jgi:hypothetical protein